MAAGVASLALPAVWVEPLLLVGQSFGLQGEDAALLASHLLPLLAEEDADRSVVLAGVHLRILHSEPLGEQHEGVHWPLALTGRGAAAAATLCFSFSWLWMSGEGMAGTVAVS